MIIASLHLNLVVASEDCYSFAIWSYPYEIQVRRAAIRCSLGFNLFGGVGGWLALRYLAFACSFLIVCWECTRSLICSSKNWSEVPAFLARIESACSWRIIWVLRVRWRDFQFLFRPWWRSRLFLNFWIFSQSKHRFLFSIFRVHCWVPLLCCASIVSADSGIPVVGCRCWTLR